MDWRCLTIDPWPLTQLQKCVHRKDKQIKFLSVETSEVISSNHTLLFQYILISSHSFSLTTSDNGNLTAPWYGHSFFPKVSITWKSFLSKQNQPLCDFGPCFPFCLLVSQGIEKRIWDWLRQTDHSSLYSKHPLGPITITIVYSSPVVWVGRGRLWKTHCLNSEMNLS